jgi:hypothetical protein
LLALATGAVEGFSTVVVETISTENLKSYRYQNPFIIAQRTKRLVSESQRLFGFAPSTIFSSDQGREKASVTEQKKHG